MANRRRPTTLILLILLLIIMGLGARSMMLRHIAEIDQPSTNPFEQSSPWSIKPEPQPTIDQKRRRRARAQLLLKENARTPDGRAQHETQQRLEKMGKALEWWQRTVEDTDDLYNADLERVSDDYYRVPFDDLNAMIRLPERPVMELIRKDGWGHDFEFCIQIGDQPDPRSLLVRSPGRDGLFESLGLDALDLPESDADRDITWRNGRLVNRPRPSDDR